MNRPCPTLGCDLGWGHLGDCDRADRRIPGPRRHLQARTPEAEAQIAAAREPPTGIELAMQEVDRQAERAVDELRRCGHAIFVKGCASCLREQQFALRDGVGWARAVAAQDVTPPRVLVTNHPEVTDPGERERLGLPPLETTRPVTPTIVPCPTCGELGCCNMELHSKPANDPEPDPRCVISGDDANTLDGFGRICADLEDHAQKGQALQTAYRAALEQVSRMAARRSRGSR